MAKILDVTSLGARDIPNSPRPIVSFDSGAGRGLQEAGKQIQEFGAQAAKQADEQNKLLAQSYSNDVIVNQFAPKAAELRAKYYDNQGINASTALPEYQAGLEKLRQDTLAGTKDLYTQNLLGHFMASHVTQELDGASRYAITEKDKYVDGGNVAMLKNLSSNTSLAYNDPPAIAANTGNALAVIDNQAKQKGWAPEATELAKKTYIATTAKNMIDTALANNDLASANSLYGQYSKNMDGDTALSVSKSLEVLNKRQDGLDTVNTLKAGQSIIPSVNPVDVVMKNELASDGSVKVINDSKGLVIGGINQNSYPKQFSEAKAILDSQGQDASKAYIKNFYQTEIVKKNGVDKLPANIQDVVADGLTNHGSDFQAKLLAAAKGGASRSQLLDMRQAEYDKLAASPKAQKEGWAQSKEGWDNRIKGLRDAATSQATNSANPPVFKEGVNPMDTYKNWQAVYPTYSSQIMKMPDAQTRKDRLDALENESQNYKRQSDAYRAGIINNAMQLAVDPTFTSIDQVPLDTYKILLEDHPETIKELQTRADFNAKKANKLESLDTSKNSPNGYDTVLRVAQAEDYQTNKNVIGSQDHLDNLLGKPDGLGINMKDYNDGKMLLTASPEWRGFIKEQLPQIATANGNIDGLGKQRALEWMDRVNKAYAENNNKKTMSEAAFIADLKTKMSPLAPPSPGIMEQIHNWFNNSNNASDGKILVENPDGQRGYIPKTQLEDALKQKYKAVGNGT